MSSSLAGPPLPVLSFGNLEPPTPSSLPPFPTLVLPNASTGTPPTNPPVNAASGDLAGSSSSPNLAQTTLPDLQHIARCVLKAKRIAVVCGAGISTASGIPDFRSSAGLFESLKKQYPDARLSSGKDLFDVGLFASEQNAAIFYNMIAELKKQTDAVEPTAFHSWLKELDDQGKLFRVYTQNIDALEERAGLTYGLGDTSLPLPPRRAPRSPTKAPRPSAAPVRAPSPTPTPSSSRLQPSSSQSSLSSLSSCSSASESSSYPTPRPSPSPPPPPPAPTHSTIPRCIPLHGHLSTLSCSHCSLTTPLAPFLPLLSAGQGPACPRCMEIERARSAAGDRSRGVGVLKPDVVLYGEEHKDGERVGEITRRDLMGQRPDLLLVVGTTLKVKGTKRLVRELSKVIKPAPKEPAAEDEDLEMPSSSLASNASTSSSSKKRPRIKPPPKMHTLYLNYDFPTPSRDWAGVFDCWLRGDIQEFVRAVKDEEGRMASAAGGKTAAGGKGKGKAPVTKKAEAKAGSKGRGKTKTPSGAGKPRQTLVKAPPQAPPPPKKKRSPGPPPPPPPPTTKIALQPVVEIPRGRPAPRDRSLTPGSRASACSSSASAASSGRRSARSSTVQATQSSLAKAGGAGGVQRLGFVVTKRSVGSVTGTGKAN
ncbi:hypothetical protein JCM5296_001511 [Sporobolomyces johnsonii]